MEGNLKSLRPGLWTLEFELCLDFEFWTFISYHILLPVCQSRHSR